MIQDIKLSVNTLWLTALACLALSMLMSIRWEYSAELRYCKKGFPHHIIFEALYVNFTSYYLYKFG